jgi:hypothetical protein
MFMMLKLVVLAIVFAVVSAKAPECKWKLIATHQYDAAATESRENYKLNDCKDDCENTEGCESFNFSPRYKICQLLDKPVEKNDLTYKKFYKYYKCADDDEEEDPTAPTMPTLPPTPAPPTSPPTPASLEYCVCWGDPHCTMFGSSSKITIHGACRHILSTDGCPGNPGGGTFKIAATFKYAKPYVSKSFVKEVTFEFVLDDGSKVVADFLQGPIVMLKNLDSTDVGFATATDTTIPGFPGVAVQKIMKPAGWKDTAYIYILTAPNGVKVAWNGVKQVEIGIPSKLSGSVCGICGQMGGSGDMVVGPYDSSHASDYNGCPSKAAGKTVNSITDNVVEYADSWYDGGDDDDCQTECNSF